jgi:murein L,D-transpeptidase YcbB/YkuD
MAKHHPSLPWFFCLALLCLQSLSSQAAPAAPAAAPTRDALRREVRSGPYADELQRLYEANGYQLLWSRDASPTPQAQALADALAHADNEGLLPADYDDPRLHLPTLPPDSAIPASALDWPGYDVALSRSLMRYAEHLQRGRIDRAALAQMGISVQSKPPLNLPRLLEQWAKAAEPLRELEQLEPTGALYRALKAALPQYREQAAHTARTPLALGNKALRPGDSHEAVPLLRSLMQEQGYLASDALPAADSDPNLYDEALAASVRRFQSQYAVEADGVVGGQTLKQLNMTPQQRLEQIRLGLERLRWLPEHYDYPFLVVNVPSFRLYGFNAGAPDLSKPDIAMDVIVGQAIQNHNTPVFHADMQMVVFRPYWNVPYSITQKELLPLIAKSGNYLAKNDMEIIADDGVSVGLDASQENLDAVSNGQFRLRQRPGPKNALGPIKFVFPNMNSVYLHGTPKQQLFQRARRDLSHGCIRLADPAGLAEFILKKEKGWDRPRIEESMKGEQSFSVHLSRSVPVHIFYTTALADENGQVRFYPDIYGQDDALLKLLRGG